MYYLDSDRYIWMSSLLNLLSSILLLIVLVGRHHPTHGNSTLTALPCILTRYWMSFQISISRQYLEYHGIQSKETEGNPRDSADRLTWSDRCLSPTFYLSSTQYRRVILYFLVFCLIFSIHRSHKNTPITHSRTIELPHPRHNGCRAIRLRPLKGDWSDSL